MVVELIIYTTYLLLDRRPFVVNIAVLEVKGRVVEGRVVGVVEQPVLSLSDGLALLFGFPARGLPPEDGGRLVPQRVIPLLPLDGLLLGGIVGAAANLLGLTGGALAVGPVGSSVGRPVSGV